MWQLTESGCISNVVIHTYIHTYIHVHTYNTHLVHDSNKAQSAYKNKVINYSYNHTILLN